MAVLQPLSQVQIIFSLISLSLGIIYLITFIHIYTGWKRIPKQPADFTESNITVSVVVAARNEDTTLPQLIACLKNQDYPRKLFEVIIIDDHSENRVSELPVFQNLKDIALKIIQLTENEKGKKNAQLAGVMTSKAELILFTDADCTMESKWISCMVSSYLQSKPGLIIGLVDYKEQKGLLNSFYRAEFLSLIFTGAGTAGNGNATLCNGANLAVRRTTYLSHANKLRMDIPSGDDIFLLHAIKRDPYENIVVNNDKRSVVTTQAPLSFKAFMNQRIRWGSKSVSYSDATTIYISLLVFLHNLSIVYALLMSVFDKSYMAIYLCLMLIKFMADYPILATGHKFFSVHISNLQILFFEFFYPIYISVAGLLSLSQRYSWKNRSF